jgi:hypothetical protein
MTAKKRTETVKPVKVKDKSLNKAARKIVNENATAIAKSMYEASVKGNLPFTKMLIDLAEEGKPGKAARKRRGPSAAEQLAAEPEWKPDETDGLNKAEAAE